MTNVAGTQLGKRTPYLQTGSNVGHPLRPLQLTSETCERHHPNLAFVNLKRDLTDIHTPDHWKLFSDSTTVLKRDPSGVRHVVATSLCVDRSTVWITVQQFQVLAVQSRQLTKESECHYSACCMAHSSGASWDISQGNTLLGQIRHCQLLHEEGFSTENETYCQKEMTCYELSLQQKCAFITPPCSSSLMK